RRLRPLFDLLEAYPEIRPGCLYPSHLNRSPELQDEGIELVRRGSFVDMDSAAEDMGRWVRRYFEQGGDPGKLTLSSDSDSSAPRQLWQVVQQCVLQYRMPLEKVLALVTANTAKVLKLAGKGRLEPGMDADLLVLRKDSLEIMEVIARGRRLVKRGKLAIQEKVAETSSRELHLVGEK
ncbi:MAG TPA: amidohydrolase family protein, partial [Thermoanaerobaculia bacterium]